MVDLEGYLKHSKPSRLFSQRRRPVQHEEFEQQALAEWAELQWWGPRFFHWPNERRDRREAWKLAQLGVKPGPLDNWLLLPRGGYAGAVSELKRVGAPPSAVTPDQRAVLGYLGECGFLTGVHRGFDEARAFFEGYVALPAETNHRSKP